MKRNNERVQRPAVTGLRDVMLVVGLCLAGSTVGCGRIDDILNVAPPLNVQTSAALQSQDGAEAVYLNGKSQFNFALTGSTQLFEQTGIFTDEYAENSFLSGWSTPMLDSRRVMSVNNGGQGQPEDGPFGSLTTARLTLLLAVEGLMKYEPASSRQKIGEALALIGYTELFQAEDYCAGVPLDRVLPGGGIAYGTPLTTDSLLGAAATLFDSAMAYANGDASIIGLASVGLGRALLDRGSYAAANTAVANVPTSFVYAIVSGNTSQSSSYLYQDGSGLGGHFGVADRDGGTGMNFVSAHDPRVQVVTTQGQTWDEAFGYNTIPLQFPMELGFPTTSIPVASGVEARLIQAEAALKAGQPATWAADLNALRAAAPSTFLQLANPMPGLTTDSTTLANSDMQVDVMFRERAFWLFGTGTRLSDMRRLLRQYGRAANTVYPTGTYMTGTIPTAPTYGTDVDFALPDKVNVTNPNYQGCLTSTTTG